MTDERLNTLIGGIASTLDAIHVQIARIADAVAGAVQDEEPEEMVHVHDNPIPARVVREIQARLCSGEKLTPARLCREYSQSPATMRHLLDELAPKDLDVERCTHPFRRVTGSRVECQDCGVECQDCGVVIGDMRPDVGDREAVMAQQLERSEQRCRDLEERLVALNRQLVQCEHRKTLGDDDVDAD